MNANPEPSHSRFGRLLQRAQNPLRPLLHRLAAARRQVWLRQLVGVGLLALIIGLGLAWTWVPSEPPLREKQQALSRLLQQLDAADYEGARREARMLRSADLTFEQLGTPVFVLGAAWAHDAQQQSDPAQRRTFALIASRYLEEARDRAWPAGREAQGTLLLAEMLFTSRQYKECIPELEWALRQFPGRRAQLLFWLAQAQHRLDPPQLEAAAKHAQQFIDDKALSPLQRVGGFYLLAEIARDAQQDERCREWLTALLDEGHRLRADGSTSRARLTRDQRRQLAHWMGQATALLAQLQIAAADRIEPAEGEEGEQARQDKQALLEATRHMLEEAQAQQLVSPASEMLLGRVLHRLEQNTRALAQLQRAADRYYSFPEGIAAAVEQAELLVAEGKIADALANYERVLAAVGDRQAWRNPWISAADLESSLLAFHATALRQQQFAEALQLTESLDPLLSREEALLLRGETLETWGQTLLLDAAAAASDTAKPLRDEAAKHYRAAGDTFAELAELRFATSFHLTDLWRSAENYLRGADYRRTERMMTRYLDQEPRRLRARALTLVGEARLAAGDATGALLPLQQCVAAYPRDPDAYRARVVAARALEELGRLDEAQSMLLHNLEQDALTPRSVDWRDALFELGELLHRQGVAAGFQAQQLGLNSNDPARRREAHHQLEIAGKRFQDAARRLSEAAQRYPHDPRSVLARYLLADSYRRLARVPHAKLAGEPIASRRAELARQMRGYLQQAYDQYHALANELADRRDETELTPSEAAVARNCYLVRGHMLFELGRYLEAIEAYSDATNRYQNVPCALEAYQQIAACYRRLNDPAKARGTLEQARVVLSTLPTDVDYKRTTRFSREGWVALLQ